MLVGIKLSLPSELVQPVTMASLVSRRLSAQHAWFLMKPSSRSPFACIFRGPHHQNVQLNFRRCITSKEIPTIQGAMQGDGRSYKSLNVRDLMSLEKRVTLITGAGRGIGLAMARGAAELGSDVAILDALESPHKDALSLSQEFGVRMKYYRTDVTQFDEMAKTFDKVSKDFGGIDNCVTCAGTVIDKQFLDHEWEESARLLNINVMGSLFTAQLAAKAMRQQNRAGNIVLIASSAAHGPTPSRCMSVYSASKGAIKTAVQPLAVELAPLGIRVNSLSPGFISTEMVFDTAAKNPRLWSTVNNAPLLKRIGYRGDLKGAVGFLLSDASAYITGTDLLVDGGLHCARS